MKWIIIPLCSEPSVSGTTSYWLINACYLQSGDSLDPSYRKSLVLSRLSRYHRCSLPGAPIVPDSRQPDGVWRPTQRGNRTSRPLRLSAPRTSRNEHFILAHIHTQTGILTHALQPLPTTVVRPFPHRSDRKSDRMPGSSKIPLSGCRLLGAIINEG